MSLMKTAEFQVLSVESAQGSTLRDNGNPFVKTSHRHEFEYERREGYIYVRSRAISSRTNDNYDQFPAEEIKKAYRTFIGKPVFVNHHNSNHRRARGFIIDAALHEDLNPDGTPDTWAEVLMEVDAVKFPRLAEACVKGDIARTSMGTDVRYSVCTACGNKAETPADYCSHIPRMKGMKLRRVNAATGRNEEVLIAEVCYGLGFFENSLLVEDPADPTAYVLGVDGLDFEGNPLSAPSEMAMTASRKTAGVSEVMDFLRGGIDSATQCPDCGKGFRWDPETLLFTCPQGHPTRPDLSSYAKTAATSNWPSNEPSSTYGMKYDAEAANDPDLEWARDEVDWDSLPTSQVPFDSLVATEEKVSKESIEHYRNIPAPPNYFVSVLKNRRGQYVIADGHHRVAKAFNEGKSTVLARVFDISSAQKAAAMSDWVGPYDLTTVVDLKPGDALWAQRDEIGARRGVPATVVKNSPKGVTIRYDHSGATHTITDEELIYDWDLRMASTAKVAHGEVKAPSKVDTLRADRCPVCQDDEAFNGDKCSVCGHVEPPSNFRDPDLTKAQEVDLRQENAEGDSPAVFDPPGEMETSEPGAEGDLECDNCGEVFTSAEGQPEEESVDPDQEAPEGDDDTSPFPPKDEPEDPADDEAEDLSDLAEVDEPVDEDQDPEQDDEAELLADPEDPEKDPDVETQDDTFGEAQTAEEAAETDPPVEGDRCPNCGRGTLASTTTIKDPAPAEFEKTDDSNQVVGMSKERVDMNQPNPAQEQRRRLTRAVAAQQQIIEGLHEENRVMKNALSALVVAAGVQRNPRFASLMAIASDDSIDMTTEQARQPLTTDTPESQGSTSGANDGVTPEATTDVQTTDVTLPEDAPLDNLQDVTKPTAGTDSVDSDAVHNGDVRATAPNSDSMDNGGWDSTPGSTNRAQSSAQDIPRFTASMRLARLQIQAGLATGEDLAVAQTIHESQKPTSEILAVASTLSEVASTKRQSQRTEAHRHLVPQPSRQTPSFAPGVGQSTAGAGDSEEFLFGFE